MKQWDKIYKENKSYGASLDYMLEMAKVFRERKVKRILDLGCGSGKHTIYLAKKGFEVYGFDISQNAIETARELIKNENMKIDFKTGSMYKKLPYVDNFFDAVISVRVLNHGRINQIKKTIKELERVLKPKGLIFISVHRILSRKKTQLRLINKMKVQMLDENTYYPLLGRERDIIHYIFNRKSIEQEFKKFEISNFWLYRGKEKWERYYYFVAELRPK